MALSLRRKSLSLHSSSRFKMPIAVTEVCSRKWANVNTVRMIDID